MQQERSTVCIKQSSRKDYCKEKFIYVFKTEEGESTYLVLKRKAIPDSKNVMKELHLQLIASIILIPHILSIVEKLDEIALRPNPMSAAKDLELLIEKVQRDHNPERVKTLTDVKKQEKLKSNFVNLVDE
ncbi:unnamed protein product [Coregonus sp. 'balchen']|nr:unnamed protein product [Coregonus sp. 'balchen']